MTATLRSDAAEIYRSSWAFMLACPVLFAIPVIVEMAQHIVELRAGMYLDESGALAAEADPVRMQFGFAKTLALLLPGYWFTRFVLFDGDAARARRAEWPSIGLWLAIFSLMAVRTWCSLFGPSLADMIGIAPSLATPFAMGVGIAEAVLMLYLAAWLVAWPLGNGRIGPVRSFAIMRGSFLHALALFVVGFLPLMILHYGLAIAAVLWLPAALDWVAMAFDSLVVGMLALTMTGATATAARTAALRKGVNLLPDKPFPVAPTAISAKK